MTFKERLRAINPDKVRKNYSGAYGCPSDYGFEKKRSNEHCSIKGFDCKKCWNREIRQ